MYLWLLLGFWLVCRECSILLVFIDFLEFLQVITLITENLSQYFHDQIWLFFEMFLVLILLLVVFPF